MKKFIYNSSLPRSGSELLQVILHQNPRIYGSSTSPLLEFQFGARVNLELPEVKSQDSSRMQAAFIGMCSGMANSYYDVLTDRPVVCDKNRGWTHYYEWVAQWDSDPKMIVVVRDLRSILASFERIYRKNRYLPIGPDNPTQLQNMTVAQRMEYWLTTQPVGLALSRLLDLFQRNLQCKVLFIRYEDLTIFPDEEMKKLYDFIQEPYFAHDFSNLIKEVQEDCAHFGPYGNHTVQKVLKPFKHRDWSDVLNTPIAETIVQNNKWFFETFGYNI